MRGVDIGGARHRQLEAILRPLLLGFRVGHADADDRPRAALREILRLLQRAHHVDAEKLGQETARRREIAAFNGAVREELGRDQRTIHGNQPSALVLATNLMLIALLAQRGVEQLWFAVLDLPPVAITIDEIERVRAVAEPRLLHAAEAEVL